MREKANAIFTIVFLASIIIVFTAADFFHREKLFSETENRLLAQKPEFSIREALFGDYTSDYEKYVTDQFVGRDKWIYLKTWTDILLQKKTVNGVYLGADDYLIEQHLPGDYTAELEEEKLALLKPLVEEWGAMVMLAPTADNILSEKLPAYAPFYDEAAFLGRVEQFVGDGQYVDVYSALKQHAGEEIYYRTDHHWTSLGAYYGYLAWAEKTGTVPVAYDVSGMATASGDFLGTLHSKINIEWPADRLQYFPETMKTVPRVTYDYMKTAESYYEGSYLETKNKYGFFLDDNHAVVEIDTGYHTGKTLFVLKDSYANSLIPLIAPHYTKIYVLDLRYYNGRLFSLMEQCRPSQGMDVLVLYNCIHFLEQFSYFP